MQSQRSGTGIGRAGGAVTQAVALALLLSINLVGEASASAMADYETGSAFAKRGQFKQAIMFFDRAIAERSFEPQPYVNKGFCLASLGYHQLAIDTYSKAIKIEPKLAVAYQNRGSSYLALNKGQEALKDFNTAMSLPRGTGPGAVKVYIDRGRAFAAVGKFNEAFRDFNYVLSLKSSDPGMETLKRLAGVRYRETQVLMGKGTRKESAASVGKPAEPAKTNVDASSKPSEASTEQKTNEPAANGSAGSKPNETPTNLDGGSKTNDPSGSAKPDEGKQSGDSKSNEGPSGTE